MIHIFAEGLPKGQPRPRAFSRGGMARVYDPGTAEGWKGCIALAVKPFLPPAPMAGPLFVELTFILPRPGAHFRGKAKALRDDAPTYHAGKPDIDNLAKAVLDALTTLRLWGDDTQVADLRITKAYGTRAGCEISVSPL